MKLNKRFSLALGLFLTIALLVGCSTAPKEMATQEAPAKSWKRFHDIVDAEFVKAQIQYPMPDDVMLIDSRPFKPKYYKGHIPMAVNIPFSKMDTMMDQLPENKEALLVFYCEGPT